MVKPKKGTKQATINAFFSPTKTEQENDHKAADTELKSAGTKRPRVSSPATNSETLSSFKAKKEELPEPQTKAKTKAKAKLRCKSKGKASSQSRKKKKQQPVRFTSPHALTENEEEEEDLDDDDDVFNTPEAKKARAELETGGESVPAGAPILDDAIVDEEDIMDGSHDDNTIMTRKPEKAEEDVATDIIDLTTATAAESATETDGKKKTRSKGARLPVARNSKGTSKTTTKRQQKMKEKAAATAVEAKTKSVEPLDSVIQARVDTYKMKTNELTKVYSELLFSKQESDVVLQDVYGARLDCDLDVSIDEEKTQQALREMWQNLSKYALSTKNAVDAVMLPTTVEFPHEVKCLIVKGIQGRSASLSVVCGELLAAFKKGFEAGGGDMETTEKKSESDTDTLDRAASLAMEMAIKMLAQRTPHGVRPAKANVFEDTSVDALWVWEVGNLEKYFGDEAQKIVKRMRKHRKRLGQQLKTLARVVQLLHQKPIDEAKVSAEEAKVGKFGFIVDAELQKAKDRETKELEKRNAAEEKKRLDLERQEAKSEEKRKREKRDREVEEKELESSKAQKKFKSFFATAAANEAGSSDPVMDTTDVHDAAKAGGNMESKSSKIARMDATISFLESTGDASISKAAVLPHQPIFSSLKGIRGEAKHIGLNNALCWSGRRRRDPKLGVMKLLQFHENNRPAYYGTFSTRSRLFCGGRRPFAQYSKFDYSIDSDDEWEEEEPGESLSDDEVDGDESDEDNLDYEDQWLAYEDEVDYMDDAEKEEVDPMERGEGISSPMKHKLPSQLQRKRMKAKAVKPAKLEPQIIGPFWSTGNESDNCTEGHSPGIVGELLIEPVFESTLMRKAREYEEEQKRSEAARLEQQQRKEQQEKEEKAQDVTQKTSTKPRVDMQTAVAETKKPAKTTSQKTTSSLAESMPAAASSPAKAPKQIDSWFKKVPGPVPAPPKPPQSHPQHTEEQKSTTVDV